MRKHAPSSPSPPNIATVLHPQNKSRRRRQSNPNVTMGRTPNLCPSLLPSHTQSAQQCGHDSSSSVISMLCRNDGEMRSDVNRSGLKGDSGKA